MWPSADEYSALDCLWTQSSEMEDGMKSTQAMRDRIRELMSREQDDYDRAVECVVDDLEALMTALRRIRSLDEKNVQKYAQQIASEALQEGDGK